MDLEEIFSFLKQGRDDGKVPETRIISLVGGGGKTTLMYQLAEESQKRGFRTLITTTTHIQKPDENVRAYDEKDLYRLWKVGKVPVVGKNVSDKKDTRGKSGAVSGKETPLGKLTMLAKDELYHLISLADQVFVEADGAKRLPCKVPEAWEPVILPECDAVIGVVGLSALGKPLGEVCFRKERAAELLGVGEEHIMTEEDLVKILISENGTRKGVGDRDYYVVLNQCDDETCRESGKRMKEMLVKCGFKNVVLTKFGVPEK